ncbi:MAG: sugar ABC transporter permease [Acholeplasma sp.]|nr:sugar ABC transporter permease [Acholeplasma sp.]
MMFKKITRNIKSFFSKVNWSTRNVYLTVKRAIGGVFRKFWSIVTQEEKRIERNRMKLDFVLKYLNLDGKDIDIQLDLDIAEIRKDLVEKKKALSVTYKKDKNQSVLNELNTVSRVIKYLPDDNRTINRKGDRKVETNKFIKAMIYLSPALILLAVFTFWPIINTLRLLIYVGYTESDGSIQGYTIFGNFIKVISQRGFIRPSAGTFSSALINTLLMAFISVPISIVVALLIAAGLNSIKGLKGFFQTIFFLPYVTNTIAIALVFKFMFNENFGLINTMLGWIGIDKVNWLSTNANYWAVMGVMVIYSVWDSLAFKIMVFLSAIQGIDKQYYQAADIDATPKSKVFRKITVPLISPMIFYIMVTSIIGALKVYSSVITLINEAGEIRGATYKMKTIVMYIYEYLNTRAPGNLSLAAASSVVLFGIILLFTLVQMQASKKRVHY